MNKFNAYPYVFDTNKWSDILPYFLKTLYYIQIIYPYIYEIYLFNELNFLKYSVKVVKDILSVILCDILI